MTHGVSWWASCETLPGAPPLHATRRNHQLRTEGDQVGVVARHLGTPLIPWQQYVADVAGERRPDGEYEHQVVVVSVPRQTGKTTLLRAVGTHRCLVNRRDVFYTAQTGKDARERWQDLVKAVQASPAFRSRVEVRRAAGSERITYPGGAEFRVFAPTADSLHGYTPPTVMLDEAFAHTEAQGELLMGAIGPAQITITDRQLWIVSTAGTAESMFLAHWLERAIGGTPRVAVFVWAATEDMDPFAAETIAAFHPAVGFEINGKVIEPDDVLCQAENNSRAEYERAYLNRWTVTASHLIPPETWAALAEPDVDQPELADLIITYDVAHDRQTGAVLATWSRDGRPHGKVVLAGPSGGLADALERIESEWRPAKIAAAGNGPVVDLTDELTRRGVVVEVLPERAFVAASGSFLSGVDARAFTHDGSAALAAATGGLVTKDAGDQVAFSRRHSIGDTSAAIALAIGLWAWEHVDDSDAVIRFGGAA